ncbi:MAG TPA: carboxypeptidase regulatory-like domain-containing protein [Candidatus Saccharimonadia bacterium]
MTRAGERGFTLVEVVFSVAIMAVMIAAIGALYISNIQTVTLGKARAIGLGIANEYMEQLRDLPYDSVATQNGTIYPPGNIPDTQTVTRDNYKFTVKTEVFYVDDPYDGYASCPCASGPAAGKPQDLYPYDYKKAQITVTLKSSGQKVATVTTDIAGKAAETSSSTGILSIKVIDASGVGIPNANVTIVNTNPNPNVNIATTTDNNGFVIIPKLPPDSANRYQVTASLPGYSTDGTIPDPPGAQTAVKLNPNVLAQQITQLTLAIDRVSTLYAHVVDTSGNPKSNFTVTITGSKMIKQNPTVYKYGDSSGNGLLSTTDSNGDITLTGMEWDSYNFKAPSGWYLVSSSPYQPAALNPNSSLTVTLVVSNDSTWPTVSSVTPTSAQTGTASVSFAITGTNLSSGTSVKLKLSGQSDINATGCTSSGGNTKLTCSVDLTGAATGAWDIAVTKSGNTATQTGGFNVTP